MVWYLILSVLLCITGLFMLIPPNAYYRETQAWKQNKPTEPLKLDSTRFLGQSERGGISMIEKNGAIIRRFSTRI